jgi:hypothetical protein
MVFMRLAATDVTTGAGFRTADDATHRFAGVLLVSLFNTLFWTALLTVGGAAIGHPPSAFALLTIGAAIAAFLAAVAHKLFVTAR